MPITYLKDFVIWDFYSPLTDELKFIDKSNLPYITYDNGFPCCEANSYLLAKAKAGKSLKIDGGTVKTYAKDIHHLVRYCYQNNLPFEQLNDDRFRHFIQTLQGERNQFDEKVRSSNHVLKIGKQCLDFLQFIGESKSFIYSFIGEGAENAIRVTYKKHEFKIEGYKRKIVTTSIHHPALPRKEEERKRLPVSDDVCNDVWNYISRQEDKIRRVRDCAIYQCLEELGGRVSEIHLITVDAVKNATKEASPYLVVPTLKRRDGTETRIIPVTPSFLRILNDYILSSRKKIIKKTIGKANDHGYLLVSTTSGKQLKSGSITSLLNKWKKDLKISQPLHPHLFRHAFITNKLIELLRQHEINNEDEFRKTLLHTEMFKMKLQQWTGHTSVQSLDRYLHLAVAHINGYDEAIDLVELNSALKTTKKSLEIMQIQIKNKEITSTELMKKIEEMLDAFDMTLQKAMEYQNIE